MVRTIMLILFIISIFVLLIFNMYNGLDSIKKDDRVGIALGIIGSAMLGIFLGILSAVALLTI